MATITEPAADTSTVLGRRPLRIPGQGILLANVALVLVGLLILDVQIFSRASLSTLTPTIGVMIMMALGQAFIIGTGGIDLSIPSTTTLVGAIVLKQSAGDNGALVGAVLTALLICIAIGLVNGLLVEVTRLDALVVTLATGQLIAGITRIYRGPVLNLDRPVRPLRLRAELGRPGQHDPDPRPGGRGAHRALDEVPHLGATARRQQRRPTGRREQRPGRGPPAHHRLDDRQPIVGVGAVLLAGRISTPDLTLGQPYLLTPIVAVVLGGAALSGGRVRPAATLLGAVFLVVLEHILRVRGYSSGVSLAFQGLVLGLGLTLVVVLEDLRWSVGSARRGGNSSGRSTADPAVNTGEQE